jgi:hypothetical protein
MSLKKGGGPNYFTIYLGHNKLVRVTYNEHTHTHEEEEKKIQFQIQMEPELTSSLPCWLAD